MWEIKHFCNFLKAISQPRIASANLGAACSVSLKCTHSLLRKFFNGLEKELEKNYGVHWHPESFKEFLEEARSPLIKVV